MVGVRWTHCTNYNFHFSFPFHPFPIPFVSFTLTPSHIELLSPCTQTSPLCLKNMSYQIECCFNKAGFACCTLWWCVSLPTKPLCLEHSTLTNLPLVLAEYHFQYAKPSFFLLLKGLYSKFTFVVTLTFSLTPLLHLIHGNQADLQASSEFARHHP